jgi:cobalt-zinc-cadmium efflux system protein
MQGQEQGHQHHGHHHHHHHADAGGRMGMVFFLNLAFAVIELVGGLYTNSLAILSDAFHDLGDSLAIGIAWFLEKKSMKGKTKEFSYGYRRFSVMAAMITGLILMLGSGLIVVKAIPRLFDPQTPDVKGMLWLAILGLAVNGIAALRISKGNSLNERMILWHLLEDVLGWAVILVGSIVMYFKPMPILDPIMALGVAFWVLWNVFHNLKETMKVFLQATPDSVNITTVEESLKEHAEVHNVHHTHLWSMDGVHHILTTHLTVKLGTTAEAVHSLKIRAKKKLFSQFHIQEATIEIEWPDQECYDPEH